MPSAAPEHAGLGPYDLQDPVWVKMSAAGVTKKRKKSDTKPQAQINKCNNEKRRREQENIYIEELAELISASFADMSSLSAVKPDKCAILQETVNQIRRIKEEERTRRHLEQQSPSSAAASPNSGGPLAITAVQQGEVSSSRPTDILANADFAPYLLEALEGFLIIVSKEGRIEQCSTNIEKYIRFTYEEVIHKDFFNFIHLGDTARFSAILKPPMSVDWTNDEPELTAHNRSFTCRFLVKPSDDLDERSTRIDKYEQMHVCSAEVQYPPNDENAETCLMCIARRIPHTEKAKVVSSGGSAALEQFSTKLDIDGKIVSIDTSAVSAAYSPYINKGLVGSVIQELCPSSEVPRINAHLKEVIQTSNPVTTPFRLRFASAPDKYINIQSTSKFFKNNLEEHIMSTHFIIGISEVDEIESGGETTNAGGGTPIGDPVMASVMNGAAPASVTSAVSTPSTSTASLNNNSSTSGSSYNLFTSTDHESDFFFPTSTWDMDLSGCWGDPTTTTSSSSRPDSRHSAAATPVSTPTPRPPSASPCGSGIVPCVPSPAVQPGYPFTPMDDASTPFKMEDTSQAPPTPLKENIIDESLNDSGRLRNLLTKRPSDHQQSSNLTSPTVNSDDDTRNKHRILKGLLNQDDDDESKHDIKMSPRGLVGGLGLPTHQVQEQPKVNSGNNHMLLRLLNDKSDDDEEARAGLKKQSELLQQLLKEQDDQRRPGSVVRSDQQNSRSESMPRPDGNGNSALGDAVARADSNAAQDDPLLRSLGFTNSPSPPARKRTHEESEDPSTKRFATSTNVSTSGNRSQLCEKNKMLAQLLAKQPAVQPIPTLPARVITATPQELPRVGEARKMGFVFNKDVYNNSTSSANTATTTNFTARNRVNRPPNSSYLNQMLANHPNQNNSNDVMSNQRVPTSIRNIDQQNQYGGNAPPGCPSTGDNLWDTKNDPVLSDILDQVIDFVPEAYVANNSTLMNILDEFESPQSNNVPRDMNEKMAINAIQKSLMLCESAVKSPSSPNMSLPPGTPPAYSASPVAMTSTSNSGGFPPPPGYPQRPQRFMLRNPQYAGMTGGALTPQQIQMQRTKLLQQQEQKRRLLQQQQQQQLLIPSNATAAELSSGLTNIDSLINNSVAPNVSLQRSSSVPESQLSPGYNMSPGPQRLQQPYSPGYSQTNQFQNPGSRLSPLPLRPGGNYQGTVNQQSPQQQQQQQQQTQQQQQQAAWSAQQSRLGMPPQQQNPMLNAQLAGAGYQNRSYANVQRNAGAMNPSPRGSGSVVMAGSPGSASGNARQSPFQGADGYQTPGPPGGNSPTQAAPPYSTYQQQQQAQAQQHRLQRTVSAPTATTHLPGGLSSPRHYSHPNPHHVPPPSHPHLGPQYPHSGQQGYDSVQYCYDQSGLQLAYNGADRGRAPPTQGGGTVSNNMTSTSEYVRQELRAVVGARTGQQGGAPQQQQQQSQPQQQQPQQARVPSHIPQLPGGHQVTAAELEALSLTFEMPPTGASDSPKIWGAMGSNDIGSMSPQASATLSSSSRTIMEEPARPGDQKSSLLQKLLSE